MMFSIIKILLSACVISLVSWLSGKKAGLAGFLTALPLTSVIALAFSYIEWKDQAQTINYAKSIFFAVPISLMFFVPFLFAERFQLSFWSCYFLGVFFLGSGYFFHQYITQNL